MCEKRGYRSERHAREAARKMGKRVRTYLCPDCRAYHLAASTRSNDPDALDHLRKVKRVRG